MQKPTCRKTPLTIEYMASRMVTTPSGCHEWDGNHNNRGYGRLIHQNRAVLAHRMWWTLNRGPIPKGVGVLHRCDNPPCCNIDHLFLGTQKDNIADCAKKGRCHQKISISDAQRVRAAAQDALADLAKELGVTRNHLHSIRRGRCWRHLPRHEEQPCQKSS